MISELEKNLLVDQVKDFKRGLKAHCEALQAYVDIWAKDPENPFSTPPEVGTVAYKMVLETMIGTPEAMEAPEVTKGRHLVRAIIRRFYKKLK